jgi:hypothetical protein
MNPKLPTQSSITERLLRSVLPPDFKIVSDKTSNGYKYVNLLYGVEFQNLEKNINSIYNDSFLPTINLTNEHVVYETYISGIPNTQYLKGDSTPIKITDQTEFDNGSPTRLLSSLPNTLPIEMYTNTYTGTETVSGFNNGFDKGFNVPCWSNITGVVGLEYVRSDLRGSGYLIISSDIDQEVAYHSGVWPTFVIDVGNNLKTSGDYKNTYGLFTGIADISYSGTNRLEVLTPITEQTLRQQYPLSGLITDVSGKTWTIDHYTPYNGYRILPDGNVVANIDYPNGYYYTDSGEKIYYRTAFNNPYGFNNYSGAILPLDFVPISGTLKVFDIDCLDISGNAIEIPSTGKNVYYYQSPKMFLGVSGEEGIFDPVYQGYESIVPSGYNYGSIEGSGCSLLKTTTWNYLHEGLKFDDQTLSWIDGTGIITNAIWISGYVSRYMVEYKTKIYDRVRYFSSINSNGLVSFYTPSPLVSTASNSLTPIDYEFTRDPDFGNESSKIVTLDGIKYRPNSIIDKISFNLPVDWIEGDVQGPIYESTKDQYAGYSNEFIPDPLLNTYIVNCQFISRSNTELNTISNNYNFIYSGVNPKLLINYDRGFGKKIINNNLGSYFYCDPPISICSYLHFVFDCTIPIDTTGVFMDLSDNANQRDIQFHLESGGYLKIYSKDRVFTSKTPITFNNKKKSFILKYVTDELSYDSLASTPDFRLYFKEQGDAWYAPIDLSKTAKTNSTITSDYVYIYKDFNIDIGGFKVYYNLYEEE